MPKQIRHDRFVIVIIFPKYFVSLLLLHLLKLEFMTNWKRNTILFLAGQTMSLFGTMLVQYAIMWHIVLETQSGVMMTIYMLVAVLPTFFTSLFGGVWGQIQQKKSDKYC